MSSPNKDRYDEGPKSFGLSAKTSWFDGGDKTLPGPGAYENVRYNKTNPPGWKLGTSAERDTFLDKFHFKNPPPNIYDSKLQKTHPQFPAYSIPLADKQINDRNNDENNSLLYKPNYNASKIAYPQYSLGFHEENDYSTPNPAPNQYHRETKQNFFNKTQRSFSLAKRPLPYGQEVKFPGSTKYHIQNYRPPTIEYSIGKGQRPEMIVGKDAPGVFYAINGSMTKTDTVKRIMKPYYTPSAEDESKRPHSKNDFPSPDKYNPNYMKSKRNIITTKANRVPLQNTAVLNNPSPQKYNTQMDFYKRNSFFFTKDIRQKNQINDNPGPGTHDIVAQLGTKSGIMGKKLKEMAKFVSPGADHYEPKSDYPKQVSPRIINFYSNRVDFSKSLTGEKIGPGSYKIQKQTRAQLGKISQGLKFAKQSNKNPGPGSYQIPNSIGKLPKYYTGSKKITREGLTNFTVQKWQKEKKQVKRQEQAQNKPIQEQNRKQAQVYLFQQ